MQNVETKTFTVPNIGCDGCVRSIKNAVNDLPGVEFVAGDENTKQVTVRWEAPANWQQITEALKEIDYAPAELINP
jgi:copper chaperone CopZ